MENSLELRHLGYFLTIAEELHFGRAAARLHLAQPSLSQQIQRLERRLGVELLSRTSHEVKLTAAGRAFQIEARRVLEHAQRAVEVARDAASGRTGTITIGFNFTAGESILQPTLVLMNANYPDVSTTLWEAFSGPQLRALRDGKIDIALMFAGAPVPQLRARRVMTVPLVATVRQQHPWADRQEVPFRELVNQRVVLVRRDHCPAMHNAIFAAADKCGISLNIADEVDSAGATAVVVATKNVVAFGSAARSRKPGRGMVNVKLIDPTPLVGLYAVWQPQSQPVVGAFLNSLDAAGPFAELARAS